MGEREHSGKIALVTGASRGIGRAIALRLAREGAKILCASRSLASSASTVEAIRAGGGEAEPLAVDVSQSVAVQLACEEILGRQGRVDILVNCAGINRDNLLLRMRDEEWDAVVATDLSSCFHWTRHLCRPMVRNRWGRIITIASVIGLVGNGGQANYAAAKAGAIAFTKSVARELASRNITANAIAPGFIETDMTAALPEAIREKIRSQIPMDTLGSPEDVAHAVAFLASEQARYITGHVLNVDGGMVMA
ncbi:MAG: 3-oxoacyl-[acyl-carrier-protein] reductase [Puniceicoccales bacterium]|jgi:3-oxoacyl-[acyl-carrier protein] reductase|nr:3-oxoacyl-[acyl-carrier-protein] reductase [Puniceicoccales bacterium]